MVLLMKRMSNAILSYTGADSILSSHNGTYTPYRPRDRSLSRDSSPTSNAYSIDTYDSYAASASLPALQTNSALEMPDQMEPIDDDDPRSFDLVVPAEATQEARFSLETRSQQLMSREHLKTIFADPPTLLRFTAFLSTSRPQSVPILIYYLDALKALKAISYANAVAEALTPLEGYAFTTTPALATVNTILEDKANQAFDALVKEDLPAYVTYMYIQIVSLSITRRVTGTLASHLREASEGLAEVFCLTDPSRPDNPIVFASEGAIGRCSMNLDKANLSLKNSIERLSMVWVTSLGAIVAFFRDLRQVLIAFGGYGMLFAIRKHTAKYS